MSTDDLVQRAREALDGSWEGEHAVGRLVADLTAEVETLRVQRYRLFAAVPL